MQESTVQTYLYRVEGRVVEMTPQKAAQISARYDVTVTPLTRAPIARDGDCERGYSLAQEVRR